MNCSCLEASGIDLATLTPFQRVLLTTNGTLTHALEAIFLEPILLVKLSENLHGATRCGGPLDLSGGESILRRVVVLRGKQTGRTYVHARSRIVLDRLEPETKAALLERQVPVGRIWEEQQVELVKKFIRYRAESAGAYAVHFDIQPGDLMFRRTYVAIIRRRPAFLITERYPDLHPARFELATDERGTPQRPMGG